MQRERDDSFTNRERHSVLESAARRGNDDRRGVVKPWERPAPRSPAPDREAIRRGEEILARVKAY